MQHYVNVASGSFFGIRGACERLAARLFALIAKSMTKKLSGTAMHGIVLPKIQIKAKHCNTPHILLIFNCLI
jgi:hypothetical protein